MDDINVCEDVEVLGVQSSSVERQQIDIGKRVFCNSAVNMKNIVAVGFDMDYTLAQYKPDTFESLAYDGTVEKLVSNLGYPKEVSLYKISPIICRQLLNL